MTIKFNPQLPSQKKKFNPQLNFIFLKIYKQIDYCFLGRRNGLFKYKKKKDVVAQNYDFFNRYKIMKTFNRNFNEKHFIK